MMKWLQACRRGLLLRCAVLRLELFLHAAVLASDDRKRTAFINSANSILAALEARGLVSHIKRLEIGQEWVRRLARRLIPVLTQQGDARTAAQFGSFLGAD